MAGAPMMPRRGRPANLDMLADGVEAGGSSLQGPVREAARAQLPPDRFVLLDGGHCLHRDLPDRWLAVVGEFADAVLAPAP